MDTGHLDRSSEQLTVTDEQGIKVVVFGIPRVQVTSGDAPARLGVTDAQWGHVLHARLKLTEGRGRDVRRETMVLRSLEHAGQSHRPNQPAICLFCLLGFQCT